MPDVLSLKYMTTIDIIENDKLEAGFVVSGCEPDVKNRAYINALGAEVLQKYLRQNGIKIVAARNIHSVRKILNEFDIADVMLENIHIDVRVTFDEDNIFVPKSHFEYNLTPDIYVVFKMNQYAKDVEFLGFFTPRVIDDENCDENYYFVNKELLTSPDNFIAFVKGFTGNTAVYITDDELDYAQTSMVSMIDNEIEPADKKLLLKQLAKSALLRDKFIEFENFEMLSVKTVDANPPFGLAGLEPAAEAVMEAVVAPEIEPIAVEIEPVAAEPIAAVESVLEPVVEALAEPAIEPVISGAEVFDVLESLVVPDFDAPEPTEADFIESLAELEIIEQGLNEEAAVPDFAEPPAEPEIIEEAPDNLDDFVVKDDEISDLAGEIVGIEDAIDEEPIAPVNEPLADEPEIIEEDLIEPLTEAVLEPIEVELEPVEIDLEPAAELLPPIEIIEEAGVNEEIIAEPLDQLAEEPLLEPIEPEPAAEPVLEPVVDEEPALEPLELFEPLESLAEPAVEEIVEPVLEEPAPEPPVEQEQEPDLVQESITAPASESLQALENVQSVMDEPPEEPAAEPAAAPVTTEQAGIVQDLFQELNNSELLELIDSLPEAQLRQEEEDSDEEESAKPEPQQQIVQDIKEIVQDIKEIAQSGAAAGASVAPKRQVGKKRLVAAVLVAAIATATAVYFAVRLQSTTQIEPETHQEVNIPPENPVPPAAHVPSGSAVEQQPVPSAPPQLEPLDPAQPSAPPAGGSPLFVRKVVWEVPEYLSYSSAFKDYLSSVGKTVKISLSNDLLLATEYAYNKQIRVEIGIDRTGAIKEVKMAKGTGSTQIDEIVLQSVKAILDAAKPPADEIKGLGARVSINITL